MLVHIISQIWKCIFRQNKVLFYTSWVHLIIKEHYNNLISQILAIGRAIQYQKTKIQSQSSYQTLPFNARQSCIMLLDEMIESHTNLLKLHNILNNQLIINSKAPYYSFFQVLFYSYHIKQPFCSVKGKNLQWYSC